MKRFDFADWLRYRVSHPSTPFDTKQYVHITESEALEIADMIESLRAEVEALRLQVENYRLANGAIRGEGE